MKGKVIFLTALFFGVGFANAAVRDTNTSVRTTQSINANRSAVRNIDDDKRSITSRDTQNKTTRNTVTSRNARNNNTNIRNIKSNSTARSAKNISDKRAAKPLNARNITQKSTHSAKEVSARNAVEQIDTTTVFGSGYNTCRDAYFTCMDQFCGTASDTYRRCICSSRLTEIQSRERALSQTAAQIQDFKNLNIYAIDKTGAEVGAMLSATIGEQAQANAKDTSDSAAQLSNIGAVLSGTKNQSLSSQSTLDIAGDIKQIWNTTDFADGANIANLTGESLYNAVHAQCSELVAANCPDIATKTMVVSAYGMYIENDCSLLIGGLDKKLTAANSEIRTTENEMGQARYENYNVHNSTSINDCIAQVRQDITSAVACGPDYVHCLDITGRYLNIETGEPIYSAEFFELGNQLSLSGNILENQKNTFFITRLNDMKIYADRGLNTCRDISDEVWDEYMRQAITEIYQGQQERIRQVKDECLTVVNTCYDTQTNQLKSYDDIEDARLLGLNMELSEQMCKEKLDACSNLYGGSSQGMDALITAMKNIVSQQIAQQCQTVLRDYAKKLCTPPSNDTLHAYPYACRMYNPGEGHWASKHECNLKNAGIQECDKDIGVCYEDKCKDDEKKYLGSLYHKMVRYARQMCMRPSANDETETPDIVLQDVRVVMDELISNMTKQLYQECDRFGGEWSSISSAPNDTSRLEKFDFDTQTDYRWGTCTNKQQTN